MAILSLRDLSLNLGGLQLLDGASLQIEKGERLGLVGRNGAGKSTLMKVINGDITPDEGNISTAPGTRIARLVQEVPAGDEGSTFRLVAAGLGPDGELLGEYVDLAADLGDDPQRLKRFESLQLRLTERDLWPLQAKVEKALSHASLDAEAPFATLSSGLKRRALFARAMVTEPDILLLDEPTNHMDIEAILRLEQMLQRDDQTLLFTTHDRAFLSRLATRILDLDRGKLRSYAGDYSRYLETRQAELDAEAKQAAAFDKKLAQEEAWIRRGIKARRTRNEGRVRALEAMRDERAQRREQAGKGKMVLQEAERSGQLVIKADKLSFARGESPIVTAFSTLILRGDRIGIVGPNGVGKTTLIKLLLGELEPDEGTVRHGTKLQVATFDQLREQLDEDKSVAENVMDGGGEFISVDGKQQHIMGYLQDFLFTKERARNPIHNLSGGERARLLLARLFTRPANVLVLDEPTNDLDIETLELLEEQLAAFSGTVIVVSHDRAFLDNVVTSTLVFGEGGEVAEYAGGYSDMLRQRPSAKPAAKPAKAASSAPSKPAKGGKKLSYKEQRELDGLPETIERLEASQAALTAKMGEADFYKADDATIAAASKDLEDLNVALERAYARWEALEEKQGE